MKPPDGSGMGMPKGTISRAGIPTGSAGIGNSGIRITLPGHTVKFSLGGDGRRPNPDRVIPFR
jgi:hypothetical protein